jgi:rRNA-processing protein FCF1
MAEQVTITWQVSSNFATKTLEDTLARYGTEETQPTNKYQLRVWKADGLAITLYEKSLVVQGCLNDNTRRLMQNIAEIKGLSLDSKNAVRLARVLPKRQNAILCPECGQPFFMIEASIAGLDVLFTTECGHADRIRPPLMMLNSRILPDISVLVSKAISRLTDLGHFVGFEILVPDFVLNALDLLGSAQKDAASIELTNLRKLEQTGALKVINYKDGLKMPTTKEEFQAEEDNRILEIAHLTNAILVTSDKNLKDKALIGSRPTIHIPGEILGKLRIVEQVRTP